jgi:hypothetical protein
VSFDARLARVLADASCNATAGVAAPWPCDGDEPSDLAALYARCDGVLLSDGTKILARGELLRATAWMREDKSLDWALELIVIGERDDLVVLRDPRDNGGVLEAPTDALGSFRRVARDVVGYVELRLGLDDATPAPELAATRALERGDRAALREALEEGFYPGAERDCARAWLGLGALEARAGLGEEAWRAFERALEMRVASAPRGRGERERALCLREIAIACNAIGSELGRALAARATS